MNMQSSFPIFSEGAKSQRNGQIYSFCENVYFIRLQQYRLGQYKKY